jgi:hypothetical protein
MFVGQVVYYELNIDYITEKFCENKAKPELQCNGKCHLAKELQLISSDRNTENETPQLSFVLEIFSPLFFQAEETKALYFNNDCFIRHQFFYKENRVLRFKSGLLKPPIA